MVYIPNVKMEIDPADLPRDVRLAAFDAFGEMLMTKVRDVQIGLWDEAINGNPKHVTLRAVRERVRQLTDPAAIDLMQLLVPWIVDDTIAYFLGAIEDNEAIDVIVRVGDKTINVSAISDGLSAEQYGEGGWEARFSNARPTITIE